MLKKISIALLFSFTTSLMFAAEGVKLIASSKDLSDGSVSLSTLYINSNSLVVKTNMKGTEASILFDANKEVLTYIDHTRKQYSVVDKATMKELGKQLEQIVLMIKAFYDNMPEEQKKKFKPLIEGNRNIAYNKLGNETISKWPTVKYEAVSSGEKLMVTNIASFTQLDVKKSEMQALPKLLDLIATYLSGLEAVVPSASIFAQWKGNDNPMFNEGIPVKTILYSEGSATEETTINSIESASFNLADFKVPAGYKEQKIDLNQSMK